MNKKILAALSKIESMNEDWIFELNPLQAEQHSFGRIRTSNNIVKLWSVPRTTGQLLKFLVIATKSNTILELGCSAGYSTIWLSMGAAATGGHVYTTEIFEEKVKLAQKHFKEAEIEKYITLYHQDILDTLKGWQEDSIDFVFMDADIPRYMQYIDEMYPLLSSGAIIVVDNANTHEEFLKPFITKMEKMSSWVIDKLSVDHGLYLLTNTK